MSERERERRAVTIAPERHDVVHVQPQPHQRGMKRKDGEKTKRANTAKHRFTGGPV